jgi:hypothetical protein|tara:strand:- start:37 stop:318 length:282 start_codon:yes stop_codon:yes gene_type:complete
MKTLVKKSDNVSVYIFEDSREILITDEVIKIANSTESDFLTTRGNYSVTSFNDHAIIRSDFNSSTHQLYTDVTPPTDWETNTYTFDGSNWAAV